MKKIVKRTNDDIFDDFLNYVLQNSRMLNKHLKNVESEELLELKSNLTQLDKLDKYLSSSIAKSKYFVNSYEYKACIDEYVFTANCLIGSIIGQQVIVLELCEKYKLKSFERVLRDALSVLDKIDNDLSKIYNI